MLGIVSTESGTILKFHRETDQLKDFISYEMVAMTEELQGESSGG